MNHFDILKQLYWHARGFTSHLECKPSDVQQMLVWAEYEAPETAYFYLQLLDNIYSNQLSLIIDQKFRCFSQNN
uniref:Uncharacterized protein n=1 Tax=Roseihalotalea indica TaxID=2867963 RepID=A0AA49JGI8_9BACT|nr:hypothetical protein K4G66_30060 [Tunicatimonas sp. TK19036]